METLPITLIVKAPNQQIEDQTIKCELTWTINKLKQHLSEVYPSKPPKHEQKLIYSGQLLTDSLILKDILRQYEGQETHTVHLVCTPKPYTKQSTYRAEVPGSSQQNSAQTENISAAVQPPTSNEMPSENLPGTEHPVPNPVNPLLPSGVMDINQYATQVAMMQQAYLQYITQYMQLAAHSYSAGAQIPTNPIPGQVPPQQPAPPQQPPPPQREPEIQERDWLDVFYMISRAMVLFSVVYFYSSPIRFVFVLLLGIGLYLYQIGFFRNINNNNNNNNNVPTDPANQEEQAPSRLMVMWTFFATFFASLIPEIPNAV
ncbi:unnamed protein product [Brassicogethes aeneus]|uniref:Ubiquitin-like domain-containing protein n=1 Tax=Brassicogethes aeneus TaxID=1431903 RepID=A0A9P0FG32_BRAAE|nr:unnamed protein product [Brassicogethes aeneus]